NRDPFAVRVFSDSRNDVARLIENECATNAALIEDLQNGLPLRVGNYQGRFNSSSPLKRAPERDLRSGGTRDGKSDRARHADEQRRHNPPSDPADGAKLGFGFFQSFENEIPLL